MSDLIEGFLGKSVDGKKSRMPAKLDYFQSATGLFLGLFMWGHMFFVSTILISKDFMYTITKMFEGSMLFAEPKSGLVSFIVFIVFVVFIVHALLGMRKLPINFRQYQAYKTHTTMMKHDDTTMWLTQAFTGFAMFFLGSAHLLMMMVKADAIGPYGSSMRMYDDFMWPFYLLLLLAVEFHGGIGLYRLCVKWGWFEGEDAKVSRKKLKTVKWAITAFFLALGLLTLGAYVKYGYEYSHGLVDKYKPTAQIEMQYDVKVRA